MLGRMMQEFAPLLRLQNEMNRAFEGFFDDLPANRPYGASYPGVNAWETSDGAYLEAELPGLTMDDLEVLVRGNEVTINGERKLPNQPNAAWHRRERSQGKFSRTLTLPWEIDADKVEAKLREGVLTVYLPKSDSHRPKKVKVLT